MTILGHYIESIQVHQIELICAAAGAKLIISTTSTSETPFQHKNDSSSSLVASESIPTSKPMEYADRVSGGMSGDTPSPFCKKTAG